MVVTHCRDCCRWVGWRSSATGVKRTSRGPASTGGRFLTRGIAATAYEHGVKERTVVVEFETLAKAIAAHDSPEYQAALAVLANGAERDLRIVEGIED